MRREITAGTALILVMAGSTAAQETASTPVTATIEAATLIIVTGTTDFGTVPGYQHDEFIDPRSPGPNQSTARFTIEPISEFWVQLADACPITLTRTGGTETLRFFSVFARTTDNSQSEAHLLEECRANEGWGGLLFPLNYWLGGRLEVNGSQTPGAYTGTYQISVEVITS